MNAPIRSIAPFGSGGGGKASGATEDANTLRSKSIARLLDILGDGELELVDGDKSIVIDGVPLRSAEATLNFQGVSWAMNPGIADQPALPGFSAIETEVSYGVEVKKHNPVVRQVANPLATSARVTIRLPALAYQDEKGNVRGSSVSFRIEVAAYGGAWQSPFGDQTITGKCTSPYDRSFRLRLPMNSSGVSYPWSIRVTRLSNDSDDQNDNQIPDDTEGTVTTRNENKTLLNSITEIVEHRLSYPWTAHVGMVIDAKKFGSSLPTRSYLVRRVDGMVPSNYDPVTRAYTGIWDGTLVPKRNDNVAWAVYDMLSSKRFGLGRHLSAEALEAAKWDFYEIGRYFDELVPDGFGGTEPRATFNGVIKNQREAYDLIALLMSACRGMTFWSSGAIRAVSDMPTDPIVLAHRSNVVDGNFSYQGTALKSRHTVVEVTWNDPDDLYQPAVEVVEDQAGIRRYGRRVKKVVAVGCTSRGQARRIGLWILATELSETQIVTYRAGFDHAYVSSGHPAVVPGDIVAVQDDSIAGVDWGGRLLPESTASALVLDREVTIGSVDTVAMVRLPNGTVEVKPVGTIGTVSTITLSEPLSAIPATGANWILSSPEVEPRPFRVLSVAEVEPHIYEVKGLLNDPTKYARVDLGVHLTERVYVKQSRLIGPPVALSAREYQFVDDGVARSKLTLSWSAPTTGTAVSYRVKVESPSGELDFGLLSVLSVDLDGVVAGDYTLNVAAVTYDGRESAIATLSVTATGWLGSASPIVSDLLLVGGDSPVVFSTKDVILTWSNTVAGSPSAGNPFYLDNRVTISDASDGQVLRTESVTGEAFTYAYATHLQDAAAKGKSGPARSLTISVVCRDTLGRVSDPAVLTVTNPPPAKVEPEVAPTWDAAVVTWAAPADLDYAGGIIWVYEVPGTPLGGMTPAWQGSGTTATVPVPSGVLRYMRMAAFDAWGTNDLNLSDEMVITAAAPIDTDRLVPSLAGQIETLAVTVETIQETQLRELLARRADRTRARTIGAAVETKVTEKYDAVTGALASRLDTVEAGVATASSAITDEATARADADGALATRLTAVEAETDDAFAAIQDEQTARATADTALAGRATVLEADVGDLSSSIATEQTARADADAALASSITSLQTSLDGVAASVQTEATARSDADAALASSIATLQSAVDGNTAAIQTEATTRASADAAQAASLTSLSSELSTIDGRVGAVETGLSAETAARSTADDQLSTRVTATEGAITSQAASLTSLTSDLSSLDGRVAGAETGLTDEAAARATADDQLSTRVTSTEGAITSQASQITGLDARLTTAEDDVSAAATALSALSTTVTGQGDDLAALSVAVTELSAETAAATADGSIKFTAAADQTGALARYELVARTALNGAGIDAEAAMVIEAVSDGAANVSQVKVKADRFYVMSDTGTLTPFSVVDGVVFMDLLQIRHTLTIGAAAGGGEILISD